VNGRRFRSKSTLTTAITDSAITTEDTTIATTGREILALSVTGLGTNEPADGVEDVAAGIDELRRLGFIVGFGREGHRTAVGHFVSLQNPSKSLCSVAICSQ